MPIMFGRTIKRPPWRQCKVGSRDDLQVGQALNNKVMELQEQDFNFTIDTAFTKEIRVERLPKGFKMPTIEQYGGTIDPEAHLESFKFVMLFRGASRRHHVPSIPLYLEGLAKSTEWFECLKPRSVSSFVQLGRAFIANFMSSRVDRKIMANLLAIRQRSNETLRAFLTRLNSEALKVWDLDPIVKFQALRSGIRDVELKKSMIMDEPADMHNLFSRCEKHINLVEVLAAKQEKEREPEKKN
ncbi:uncharacterized protein LOC122650738 [Telopea speciosissima]|uniref:uncharacterized protein LOC122650738 n=1 Tax=Telopea speciosissima TaxID=54955 RepID=UPI001CC75F2A|nr:uncharacterized protein LOC122650738 [Telopea speciosissima]